MTENDVDFVPNDDDIASIAKARDIATDIVDTLLLNDATVTEALIAVSTVLCYIVQQFDDPYTTLEDAVDDIVANLPGARRPSEEGAPAQALRP